MTAYDSVQHTRICRFCIENRNILCALCASVVICTRVCSTDYLQVCNSCQASLGDALELDSDFRIPLKFLWQNSYNKYLYNI